MVSRIAAIRKLRTLPKETPAEVVRRNVDFDFVKLIKNRILVGHARYGAHTDVEQVIDDPRYVTEQRMIAKLIQYMWTRNTEFLVDVCVYAMFIHRFADGTFFEAKEQHQMEETIKCSEKLASHVWALLSIVPTEVTREVNKCLTTETSTPR